MTIIDQMGYGWDKPEELNLGITFYRHPPEMPKRCADCLSQLAPFWGLRCSPCQYKRERRLARRSLRREKRQ